MNEVSGKVLGLYRRAAERYDLRLDALFEGLDVSPDREPDRFGWETLCTLNERLAVQCAGRVELDQLGELLFDVPGLKRAREAIQLVASPAMLYWTTQHWAGPSMFFNVATGFEELAPGRVRVSIELPERDRDSPEFFRINQGIYRALPRLLNLPDAQVELAVSPRRAVYTVAMPPSLTLWSRMRRGLMLVLAPRAVLAELRDQNEELRARFDELSAARDEADRLRRDAEHARDVAEAALRVKSAFLATVSHELRTPLNGITGLTEMLLGTPLSPEQREHAETILSSTNTLVGLISDVLDFSKAEAGKLVLARVDFSPRALAQDVVRLLFGVAQAKGVALSTAVDDALPGGVLGDDQRVRQVLVNLVGNGLKFTDRGSVTVRIALAQRGEGRAVVRYTVQDTGIGIAAEAVARIFEPFTQVETSARRRFGGTGLGLAICKQLVAQMGGEIGVDTAPGCGSSFWFTVPVEVPIVTAPVPALVASDPPLPTAPLILPVPSVSIRPMSLRPLSMRPKSMRPRSLRPRSLRPEAPDPARPWVLLVDDNLVNLKVAAHALRRLEYNVITATGGQRALELFTARSFDAVLMDCQMPEMDGFEATARIRALEARAAQRTPVIAVTANAMEGDRERCLASGMDDYIAKPVKLDVLRDTLTRWLNATALILPTGRPTSASPAASQ